MFRRRAFLPGAGAPRQRTSRTSTGSSPTAREMTDEEWEPRFARAWACTWPAARWTSATRAAAACVDDELPPAVQRASRRPRVHAAAYGAAGWRCSRHRREEARADGTIQPATPTRWRRGARAVAQVPRSHGACSRYQLRDGRRHAAKANQRCVDATGPLAETRMASMHCVGLCDAPSTRTRCRSGRDRWRTRSLSPVGARRARRRWCSIAERRAPQPMTPAPTDG